MVTKEKNHKYKTYLKEEAERERIWKIEKAERDRIWKIEYAKKVRLEEEAKEKKARQIEYLYQTKPYGKVIECRVSGGKMRFRSKDAAILHPFKDKFFEIAVGDQKTIYIDRFDDKKVDTLSITFSDEGNNIEICYESQRRKCININGFLHVELKEGLTREIHIPRRIEDSTIKCGFPLDRSRGNNHYHDDYHHGQPYHKEH